MCIPEKGYVEMKMFAGKHYGVYKAKEADFYTCLYKIIQVQEDDCYQKTTMSLSEYLKKDIM